MSAGQSTIVLVHGAWHGSWAWDAIVPPLEERGLAVRTVDLPSVGAGAGDGIDLSADAAAVRAILDEVDGPILLCGHSYGGMVVTHASAGHPRVAHLVYLCAFMPEEGESLFGITGGGPAPWIETLADGTLLPDLEQAPGLFYGDCHPDTVGTAVSRLRSMPSDPFTEEIVSAGWKTIPSTYVVCSADQAIPPEVQRDVFAPRAGEVVELPLSHSPFYADPDAVVTLLAQRASG